MKSIDTNILVRFLVGDDAAQAEIVRKTFERAERRGDSYFVCTAVVLELIWVLESVYELSGDEIRMSFEKMLQLPVLEFENRDIIAKLVESDRRHILDLPDLLIGLNAKIHGCDTTLTFDKKASGSTLFELLH
ncbi:MAG TPA: VapC toxin family PIN domain ribonuclease [Lentisphaeria bacterium]|nr:MAG: twitching motility protein PilT [Lentisphaerae bacterium GWF2_50_93]HCE43525.1 VapC toxin family PIN domain ribonuclease [Lentisphaeria bacterium]